MTPPHPHTCLTLNATRLAPLTNDHGEDTRWLLARDLLVQLRIVEFQALKECHVTLVACPLQDIQEHTYRQKRWAGG
jgi:hypothetical protein